MSLPDHPHSKITIEDLLRLKKSERPAADFWTNFEYELRQKQLSALVQKRAWWHNLPQHFSRRIYLPIGATAVLAFTLISVKYYGPAPSVQSGIASAIPSSPAAAVSENSSLVQNSVSISSSLVNRSEQVAPVIGHSVSLAGLSTRSSPEIISSSASTELMAADSPSARSIAANFARLEQSEPELISAVLGSRLSSAARIQNVSVPVAELASLQLNGSKRTRLLAHYNDHQLNPDPVVPDPVRERLSRRLNDNDYNDRFTRIGVKGDQVSLKF